MKVVINDCYGGFGLSSKAQDWLRERGLAFERVRNIERHDPLLVECVETLGEDANGYCTRLLVQEISGNKYRICDYDGHEWVETPETIDWVEVL